MKPMTRTRRSRTLSLVAVLVAAVALTAPARAELVDAVEYFHPQIEHYFVAVGDGDITALDQGDLPGWWRTGTHYRVESAAGPDLHPVCRFYTDAFAAKPSYFFTASEEECAVVRTSRDWTFAGVAFFARVPDAKGNCAPGTAPVHRLYNGGMTGAPNHAYVLDAAHRETLLAAGWIAEGVAYCVPLSSANAAQETAKLAGTSWMFPDGYYGMEFPIAFAGDVRIDGSLDREFDAFGSATTPPAAIRNDNVYGAWRGVAGFVPASGKTIVLGGTGFDGDDIVGRAFELDDAGAMRSEVCAMVVYRNGVVLGRNFIPHPWQPYLWSGCQKGIARRT